MQPDGSRSELLQRYRASLGDKVGELALAWEAWIAAPDQREAMDKVHVLVHRLAGSAPAYGFDDLGREAQRMDGFVQSWVSEVEQLRMPLPALCQRVAAPMEALLRTLA